MPGRCLKRNPPFVTGRKPLPPQGAGDERKFFLILFLSRKSMRRYFEKEAAMMHAIELGDLHENFNTLFGERWGLLTAAGPRVNPMTVGWGQVGRLWNRPVCTVYVRPQRYTFGLMNESRYFSLSFLPEDLHGIVALCGSQSGRDTDKVAESGLTLLTGQAAPCYEEAELTLICRTLYVQDLDGACFLDREADRQNYPRKDYHRMYVGQIESVFRK